MPATMEVRENGRALYFLFTSPLTLQDMTELINQDRQYRDSVLYKVHALIKTEITDVPPNIIRTRISPTLVHPRRGYCALVGSKGIVRTIVETAFKITRNDKIHFFETEDQAWEFLRGKIAEEGETAHS